MKRHHYAIITGQLLSYALIITFIFADRTFNLTGVFYPDARGAGGSWDLAFVSACLVGLVGAINVWITSYYMQKSSTVQDWVVVCAWTHRVKHGNRWVSLEDFLSEQLGCQVSHGLSEEGYSSISGEIDSKWRTLRVDPVTGEAIVPDKPSRPHTGPERSPAHG
ncbi:MAG: hypothetical protein IAE82_03100 [Opitutaceae bacterium]|nr:hypothetical protein [Opitutaceae bacterium]